MSMDALSTEQISNRLGASQELAELAVHEYRRAGFVCRHPWLTFLAAPIPIFILALALHTLVIIGFASLLEGHTTETQPMLMQAFSWIGHSLAFVPAVVASLLICYWANKSDRDWRWQLTACALIAILAGMLNVACNVPTQPGNGEFSMGFGLGWSVFHLAQFLAPLAIVGCSVAMQWMRQRVDADHLEMVSH